MTGEASPGPVRPDPSDLRPQHAGTAGGHPPAGPAALLALVLSSEDALFRDPFADCIVSRR